MSDLDDFSIDDILYPEHLFNAHAFTTFLESDLRVDKQTIPEYIRANQLGLHIGFPPFISFQYNGRGTSKFATEIQELIDFEDQVYAGKSKVILNVSLGNLNLRQDLLEETFQRIADNANKTRAMLKDRVSVETFNKIETGEQAYANAWERHRQRCMFLNPGKLAEIKSSILQVLNSRVCISKLILLNGKVYEAVDFDPTVTLMEAHFVFS